MVEIIKQLKKILKGVSTLQNTAFNHHARHEDGGGDEISVAGLSGELADPQKSKISKVTIDADKNWAGKNITNFGPKGYNLNNQLTAGITFNLGVATVGTKLAQALIPGTFTISKVIAYADISPANQPIVVNIKVNGISLWDGGLVARLTIVQGSHSGSKSSFDRDALSEGDRLSIDIDQVGWTPAGGDDLLVTIIC